MDTDAVGFGQNTKKDYLGLLTAFSCAAECGGIAVI
jgi:hypothetical protein